VAVLVLIRPAWLESRWRKMVRFCLEAWAELKKVQWPSWSEVWTFTLVVLIAIMAVAIYIGFWDWIFTRVLHFLFA
jgi:preprotein translocase subunit SecE